MSLEAPNREHGGLVWQTWLGCCRLAAAREGSLPLGLPSSQPLLLGYGCQATILGPQAAVAQPRRRQQVSVYIKHRLT